MISEEITVYCIQETCLKGNSEVLIRRHLMFTHNRDKREIGPEGRIPGGVAVI